MVMVQRTDNKLDVRLLEEQYEIEDLGSRISDANVDLSQPLLFTLFIYLSSSLVYAVH